MEIFIYTDASYSKSSKLAVTGYLAFNSKLQHDQVYDSEAKMKANGALFRVFQSEEINNIRAELRGVLNALNFCLEFPPDKRKKVVLFTDCQTVTNLIERRARLESISFISQTKKVLLANADLYKEFYRVYDQIKPEIYWLKGHKNKSLASHIDKNFSILDRAVRSQLRSKTNGAGDVQVVELSLAVKFVLVTWKNLKINLNEVAVLRWIKKMTIPEICNALHKSRSAVQVSIRTLRNCGVSLLNLKDFEKNLIVIEINREIEVIRKFGRKS